MQLAVFIDFDNIEIGVKTTLNCELDLALVLDALRERGEVLSKSAYGDWARAGQHSRTLTDHAVHMVQRNVTPRGDKNGADINLVVDALEMAFTRPHITGFAIVGGDSDFIALVEKLKQFGKRVYVVGGRSFTSGILQRNCHEFIAYENLLAGSRSARSQQSRGSAGGRLPLAQGLEQVQRALKILADRGVEPQLGPLKSTLLQLDSTFSERDYGASSFREFIQRLADRHHLVLRRIDQGYRVETNGDGAGEPERAARSSARASAAESVADDATGPVARIEIEPTSAVRDQRPPEEAIELLRRAADRIGETRGGRPTYVRHLAQALRSVDPDFDETRYGFRTLTELMHVGAREGIFKMQRDRQGAWRVTVDAEMAEREEGAPERAAAAAAGGDAGREVAVGEPLPTSADDLDDDFREEEPRWGGAAALDADDDSDDSDEPARAVGDPFEDDGDEASGDALDASAEAEAAPEADSGPSQRKRTSRRSTAKTGAKSSSRGRRGGAKKKAPKATET
jgi:uncharacterized LabA/DUF88 family protein